MNAQMLVIQSNISPVITIGQISTEPPSHAYSTEASLYKYSTECFLYMYSHQSPF
jgi:hypothetical protein